MDDAPGVQIFDSLADLPEDGLDLSLFQSALVDPFLEGSIVGILQYHRGISVDGVHLEINQPDDVGVP